MRGDKGGKKLSFSSQNYACKLTNQTCHHSIITFPLSVDDKILSLSCFVMTCWTSGGQWDEVGPSPKTRKILFHLP